MKKISTLLLVFSLASCTKVEAPEFKRVSGFNVKKLGLKEASVGFGVVYYNPNNFGVSVKEAALNVFMDTLFVGRFTQPVSVEVDKKAEFTIPLEGSIPIAKALQLKVGDVVNKEVEVRAEGSVRVGKGGVYISRDVKYSGKHKLDLNL